MTLTELLAAMNSLPTQDLYDLVVKGNTLLHKRKQAAARKAQVKVDACQHDWLTVMEYRTGRDEQCGECGVTRWIDSSG